MVFASLLLALATFQLAKVAQSTNYIAREQLTVQAGQRAVLDRQRALMASQTALAEVQIEDVRANGQPTFKVEHVRKTTESTTYWVYQLHNLGAPVKALEVRVMHYWVLHVLKTGETSPTRLLVPYPYYFNARTQPAETGIVAELVGLPTGKGEAHQRMYQRVVTSADNRSDLVLQAIDAATFISLDYVDSFGETHESVLFTNGVDVGGKLTDLEGDLVIADWAQRCLAGKKYTEPWNAQSGDLLLDRALKGAELPRATPGLAKVYAKFFSASS